MITSKLRFLIPAVVLLAFAGGFIDAAKRKTLTQEAKFKIAIQGIAKKKALKPAQKESQIRQQIDLFDSGPKALTDKEMADILTAELGTDAVAVKIVKELTPAPKVPPLSATVTAKIKDIQDKFEVVVDIELNKFPVSKTLTKDPRRYVKKHLNQVNDALNNVAWNDFRLFGKDGKAYAGTMKKNDGTVLSSKDVPDEGLFTGELDGLDTTAVKLAAAQAVADAIAEKAGKKAKSGVDKAKAAAAELTALKGEIDGEITKLAAEIKKGQDLIAKVEPKANPLLGAAIPAKVTVYTDTRDALTKAITDATAAKFDDQKNALNVPGGPVAADLAQLKADIATGKILKTEIIASTKAINDLQAPFNAAYKALKPAKAPKADIITINYENPMDAADKLLPALSSVTINPDDPAAAWAAIWNKLKEADGAIAKANFDELNLRAAIKGDGEFDPLGGFGAKVKIDFGTVDPAKKAAILNEIK
ncbi:MAG: hypothetical protein V1646_01125 [bacterium]